MLSAIVGVLAASTQVGALVASAGGYSNHVLHEKRSGTIHNHWTRAGRVLPEALVPVRIALKQSNLEAGADRLLSISHPTSGEYGKHLTSEEVRDLFAPSDRAIQEVREWLTSSDVDGRLVAHSDSKGWLAVDLPAQDAERLFQTELYEYENDRTGSLRIGCDSYSIPGHLQEHVDYITPGVKFSAPLTKKSTTKRSATWGGPPGSGWPKHQPGWRPVPYEPYHHPPPVPGLPADVQNCAVNITPPCWRALYGIPPGHLSDPANSLGLYEQGDYYSAQDIDSFFKMFAPWVPQGTRPTLKSVDGGEAPVAPGNPGNNGESDLDIDITTSLIYPQTVTLYQVDDKIFAPKEVALDNTFNTFLDALDGSYCNYTAFGITGDSPGIDPVYPDPAPGGFKGQLECGVYKPTRVISASYGESEGDFPKNYVERQCNEFMKLSLQGHTIFVSSSDFGVGNEPGDPTASGCLSGFGQNQTIFNPDYPAGCPWITTVGATQINPNKTVLDPENAMQADLSGPGRSPAFKFFASAGGFSNYFKAPAYQMAALSQYFSRHNPGYPTYVANADASNIGSDGGIYNRAGRGFPDVSANGAKMLVFVNQTLGQFFGTSLASPIWASVITLINEERTAVGKGPVGFINPTLYENAWAMNDITNGSNPNCMSAGFHAVEGWDPVTGLGTPNYPKLLRLFMSLP